MYVQYVCTVCMYSMYVQHVCTVCMYSMYVQHVCTVCMYSMYVQYVCTVCMYSMYVQYVCTVCMYSMYVRCVCTVCMYSMYVQHVCEHACGTLLHMQHWTDLQVPFTALFPSKNKGPDVHWEKVSKLKTGQPYINYTGVIEKERLPAISPFTNVVRETSSSVCGVIVASCHMTHITPCHIYSIVLLLLYTVCWSTLCKTARRSMVSMRVL